MVPTIDGPDPSTPPAAASAGVGPSPRARLCAGWLFSFTRSLREQTTLPKASYLIENEAWLIRAYVAEMLSEIGRVRRVTSSGEATCEGTDGAMLPAAAREYAPLLLAVTRYLYRRAASESVGPQLLQVELFTLQLYMTRLLREVGGFDELLDEYDVDHEAHLAEFRGIPFEPEAGR